MNNEYEGTNEPKCTLALISNYNYYCHCCYYYWLYSSIWVFSFSVVSLCIVGWVQGRSASLLAGCYDCSLHSDSSQKHSIICWFKEVLVYLLNNSEPPETNWEDDYRIILCFVDDLQFILTRGALIWVVYEMYNQRLTLPALQTRDQRWRKYSHISLN